MNLRTFRARSAGVLLLIAAFAASMSAKSPWSNGPLKVASNGRYLQHRNGKPFFLLGDTAWLLLQRLDREQMDAYFRNRKAKGFNVVQCIVLQFYAHRNAYGDAPFIGEDMTREDSTPGKNPRDPTQYDFWDHLEYAVDAAARHDIYLAIAPTWGAFVKRTPVTEAGVSTFGANLAKRLRNKPNIIWLNGGSAQGDVKPEIWNALGESIKRNDPNHLMTFHTFGRTQSSNWFANASWLDFNMFTSGHRRYDQDDTPRRFGEDNWRYVLDDLAKSPLKPTIDGEASYEDLPQGIHDATQPYWQASDVRRYAYWSVFAGSLGHVYGHNSVRQVYLKDTKPESGARGTFEESLDAAGAGQMRHLRDLILSRPYFERIGDQSPASVDEGEKYDRVLVTRGDHFMMAYAHTGRTFKLRLGTIAGRTLEGWWFDPRTGEATSAGRFGNEGIASFDPPGERAVGNDWVLVLDNAAKKFARPGR